MGSSIYLKIGKIYIYLPIFNCQNTIGIWLRLSVDLRNKDLASEGTASRLCMYCRSRRSVVDCKLADTVC